VTQNTLRIIDALYALDVSLANKRHFPAISWLTSYSLYVDAVKDWWNQFDEGWENTRAEALKILQQEAELEEIVRLVGPEALPEGDKLLLLTARMIREDFLQQSAYHEVDTYCQPEKAGLMLKTILKFHHQAQEMLNAGTGIDAIRSSPLVYKISRMKDVKHEEFEQHANTLWAEMEETLVAQKRRS
jgi:V/A-type H+-transporting ATPase subunit A